ncbi:MAG: hypothetical protein KC619_29810 [Myxococcales bacterium]|nr:hypothetical protein [Myxococcales bacterium]
MPDAEQIAHRLVRRIVAVADPAIRVRYLRHEIAEMDPGTIADVLTIAVHGTEARDGDAGALLLALCLALADESSAETRERVVRIAIAQGQHATAELLHPRPPERSSDEPIAVPDFGRGRTVTLGERKALARTRDRDLLARVLRDPDPSVIRILLENPTLTERDVIRLCARRPMAPDILREVFRSTRWIVRYGVRKAIVRNPFAPVDVALQLAAHLNATDAREIVESPELASSVRDACRRVAGMATLH